MLMSSTSLRQPPSPSHREVHLVEHHHMGAGAVLRVVHAQLLTNLQDIAVTCNEP
jgi:hypothetical protein